MSIEIQIVTTKKKLSKSLLQQIKTASIDNFKSLKALGHLSNIDNERGYICLFELEKNGVKEYRILRSNWSDVKFSEETNKHYSTRCVNAKVTSQLTMSAELAKEWEAHYKNLIAAAKQTQIFL